MPATTLEPATALKLPLTLPDGLAVALGADRAHASGGRDVRVTMLSSGVLREHEWFNQERFKHTPLHLTTDSDDEYGHGTALAAVFLSIAPEAHLSVLSLPAAVGRAPHGADAELDLIDRALDEKPQVLVLPFTLKNLPDWSPASDPNDPLEKRARRWAEVMKKAVAADTLVVAAAGDVNARSLLASHPEVVSAGGVTWGAAGWEPCPETAAFESDRYDYSSDTAVPEVCALCGSGRDAKFFLFPVPRERWALAADKNYQLCGPASYYAEEWGGSGAAAAQVAAVAALVRGARPTADRRAVRAALRAACEPVRRGPAPRTGFGLISAERAVLASTNGRRPT